MAEAILSIRDLCKNFGALAATLALLAGGAQHEASFPVPGAAP